MYTHTHAHARTHTHNHRHMHKGTCKPQYLHIEQVQLYSVILIHILIGKEILLPQRDHCGLCYSLFSKRFLCFKPLYYAQQCIELISKIKKNSSCKQYDRRKIPHANIIIIRNQPAIPKWCTYVLHQWEYLHASPRGVLT